MESKYPSYAACASSRTRTGPDLATEQQHKYEKVADHVVSRFRFGTDALQGYHVEVDDLVFGPAANASILSKGLALMELRSGRLTISINGKPLQVKPVEYWTVPSGSHMSVRNLGEIAVIRRTVFVAR